MNPSVVTILAWLVIIFVVGSLAIWHYQRWHNQRAWVADEEWRKAFEPSRHHVAQYPVPDGWEIDPEPHRIRPEK